MALNAAQQAAVWAAIADRIAQSGAVRFTKADLKAAAIAADTWATANAASYNTALVTNAAVFGNNATNQEKALLLAYLCLTRAGLL